MTNIKVVIKPEETLTDLLTELCDEANLGEDDLFCFSAIADKQGNLKINIAPKEQNVNVYTPRDIATYFCKNWYEGIITYIQPQLEQWIQLFRPLLFSMVEKVYPVYQKLIPDKQDILSTLYEVIIILYNKGYYLHNRLIYSSLIHNLNKQIRKSKNFQDMKSFDEPISNRSDDTLADVIPDPNSCLDILEDQEYWQSIFDTIKEEMLKEISQLSFDRILLQLEYKCVDTQTAKFIAKYRQKYNPNYIPRPNSYGKPRGKKDER